jgi:hypothetical protein
VQGIDLLAAAVFAPLAQQLRGISTPRWMSLLSVGCVTALGWTVVSTVTRATCLASAAPARCAAASVSASSSSSRSAPMRWRQRVIEERSSGRACWTWLSPQKSWT